MMTSVPLLEVSNLSIDIATDEGPLRVVENISFSLVAGQSLALVGESGSGKTLTALSLLSLLPAHIFVSSGNVYFEGRDLLSLDDKALRAVRGKSIGYVFQDPGLTLNPLLSIGQHLIETIRTHDSVISNAAAKARAFELLNMVGLEDREGRFNEYPHQLSGGARQRVLIAMAMAHRPKLLIADEPTSSVDVSIQSQILDLLRLGCQQWGMGVLLITHDLGVVAGYADKVCVMQKGNIVETAAVETLFSSARHPHTKQLLNARLPWP